MKQLIIILSFLLVYPSCSDDTPTLPGPNEPEREDCIRILISAYKNRDIEQYKENILQPDKESDYFPEGYIWYNEPSDTLEYGVSYNFEEDWMATYVIFEESRALLLELHEGEWTELEEFRGEPCMNCWITGIGYYVEMIRELGEMNYIASSFLIVVIGPAREDPNKYVIYEAADGGYSGLFYRVGIRNETESICASAITWGELKGIFMPE